MFLKNKIDFKIIFSILGIVLLGFILRIIGIDKQSGMWYDEMLVYHQASQSLPLGIIDATINKDHHYPLYQIFLNVWMHVWGNNDIALRLFSVFTGLLCIPVAYIAGKESDSKTTGLIAATLIAVNSTMIYYSQEIKYYIFIMLYSLLVCLFLMKIIKKPSKTNFIALTLANLAILYTFLLGFAFVFIELTVLAVYFYTKQREHLKLFIKSLIFTFLFYIPGLIALVYMYIKDLGLFYNGFSAFFKENFFVLNMLQNWFSPFLTGIINNQQNYLEFLFNNLFPEKVIFIFIPVTICLVAIINSLRQKKDKQITLFLIAISFILLELLAMIFTDFVCLTRYTVLALPPAILIISHGLKSFKKPIGAILFSIFLIINIFYLFTSSNSAPKHSRPSGHRIPAIIFSKYNFNDQDVFVYPIREYLVDKYYPTKAQKISLHRGFLNKSNAISAILTETEIQKLNKKNERNIFKNYLKSPNYSIGYKKYFEKKVFNKLPKGRFFIVVRNKGLSLYNPTELYKITSNENSYENTSLLFMQLSKMTNDLLFISYEDLKLYSVEEKWPWEVYIFQK